MKTAKIRFFDKSYEEIPQMLRTSIEKRNEKLIKNNLAPNNEKDYTYFLKNKYKHFEKTKIGTYIIMIIIIAFFIIIVARDSTPLDTLIFTIIVLAIEIPLFRVILNNQGKIKKRLMNAKKRILIYLYFLIKINRILGRCI